MQQCALANEEQDEEKKASWKNRIIYSSPVRVGYWNEDRFLEEELLRVANHKRENCMLLVQKTRKMFSNLLEPVKLERETPFVKYGSVYQLKAGDLPSKIGEEVGKNTTFGLLLSGLMSERDIDFKQHFIHGCILTASPYKSPCVRNTFLFVGCDGQSDGQTIYFGDDVYIRIYASGTDGYLFLQSESHTIETFGAHLQVRLTQSPDLYCRFKLLHWNPQLRYETIGAGFPPNSRVIIQHTATGQNLAVEFGHWIPTFFGAECVVSCHTCRDCHKMETAENMWKVVSDVLPDINLYVRAAKGEDIPVDLLN